MDFTPSGLHGITFQHSDVTWADVGGMATVKSVRFSRPHSYLYPTRLETLWCDCWVCRVYVGVVGDTDVAQSACRVVPGLSAASAFGHNAVWPPWVSTHPMHNTTCPLTQTTPHQLVDSSWNTIINHEGSQVIVVVWHSYVGVGKHLLHVQSPTSVGCDSYGSCPRNFAPYYVADCSCSHICLWFG